MNYHAKQRTRSEFIFTRSILFFSEGRVHLRRTRPPVKPRRAIELLRDRPRFGGVRTSLFI